MSATLSRGGKPLLFPSATQALLPDVSDCFLRELTRGSFKIRGILRRIHARYPPSRRALGCHGSRCGRRRWRRLRGVAPARRRQGEPYSSAARLHYPVLPGSCWGVSVRIADTVRKKNPKIKNFLRNSTVCNQFSFSCRLVYQSTVTSTGTLYRSLPCTRLAPTRTVPAPSDARLRPNGDHITQKTLEDEGLFAWKGHVRGRAASPLTTAGGPRSAAGNRLVGPELPRW